MESSLFELLMQSDDEDVLKLKVKLRDEENNLLNLEKERIAIQKELEWLEKEIKEERLKYRESIDVELSTNFEENCTLETKMCLKKSEDKIDHINNEDMTELNEICKQLNNMKLNSDALIDEIPKTSKEEYMYSMKDFIFNKKQ